MPKLKAWLALAFGLVVATSLVGPAAAHESNNHGTIKVHDDAVVVPPQRNQPHVSCEFYIEGFNMADDSGHLVFYSWPPTGDKSVVTPDGASLEWTGTPDPDGDGFHFLAGPYELPDGHYRVEAYLDQGHPGNEEHFAKAKMFWVNPCPEEPVPPEDKPDCPENIMAHANQDGSITLTWDAVEDADEYRIYRMDENGDFQPIGSTMDTTFTDTDTEIGVTYTYAVTVVIDGMESEIDEDCQASATAIPFFPTAMAGAAALLGSLGVLHALRRRN